MSRSDDTAPLDEPFELGRGLPDGLSAEVEPAPGLSKGLAEDDLGEDFRLALALLMR